MSDAQQSAMNRQLCRAERMLIADPLLAALITRFGRCQLRCDHSADRLQHWWKR